MTLLDLRLSGWPGQNAFTSPWMRYSDDMDSGEGWRNPWGWLGLGLVVIAGSCLTDHWPCHYRHHNGSAFGGSGGGGGY
jgi:hypothetical protein